jgi:hypothetical protein
LPVAGGEELVIAAQHDTVSGDRIVTLIKHQVLCPLVAQSFQRAMIGRTTFLLPAAGGILFGDLLPADGCIRFA